jgi:hypothetical protein
MNDRPTFQDQLKGILHADGHAARLTKKDSDAEEQEVACPAFGYLRGIRDVPGMLEFRLRNGVSVWFPYAWLGPWWYDPSEGLLLKFSGDLVYLVLIRGSNLDKPLAEGSINLTSGGLQRHRIVWIREMTEADIRKVGETGPTIDSISIAEFESHEALKEWVMKTAPAFLH